MRFLVLLAEEDHFDKWDNADCALRERVIGDYNAFGDAVRQRGTLVVGDALQRPETARSLRPGVEQMVTDGPFAETKELIGGFAILEAASREEAIQLGKKFMQVHVAVLGQTYEGTLEVRPMFDSASADCS
jgi:hypothetical protein